MPLFIRTVKGIGLTPKDHEALLFAESILEQQHAFMQKLYQSDAASNQSGSINAIAQYLPRTMIFPDLITYFIHHYPNIQINDFPIADRQQLLLQITKGQQDVGFIYQIDHPMINLSPIPENLSFHPLVLIKPYVWCSITASLGQRQKLNLAEVIHSPILHDKHASSLFRGHDFQGFWHASCEKHLICRAGSWCIRGLPRQ